MPRNDHSSHAVTRLAVTVRNNARALNEKQKNPQGELEKGCAQNHLGRTEPKESFFAESSWP